MLATMLNFQAANFLALLQFCILALTASLNPTLASPSSTASPNLTLPFDLVEPSKYVTLFKSS